MNANNRLALAQGYVDENTLLDVRLLRPYVNDQHQCVVHNGQREIVVQNALLREYEWELIDAAVLDIMRTPLPGVADLISHGLTKPLGGLGTFSSVYEQLSDMSDADVTMNITAQNPQKDKVTFQPVSVPVPIISKPFELDIRMLEASRKLGESLDTTQIRVATRKVREQLESILFNGSTLQVGAAKIYGYTNAPHILNNTAAVWGGGDFATAGNGHKTLNGMLAGLRDIGCSGPYGAYVASTQYTQLNELIGANLAETELSVIMRTLGRGNGGQLEFVKPSYDLADGVTVLVSLNQDVVDLAIGQDVSAISWAELGGMLTQFRVLTAAVPRIKYDANNHCGVAKATSC